jgi:hypothetical protein
MKALLYIPDISGFSKFVNETEIMHGQEIISELLETVIENSTLGMKIYEIEGDAVVFYIFDKDIIPSQFYSASSEILRKFKERKEKIELTRMCECGACKSIGKLTLKFIVHKDELRQLKIKNFTKLYGKGLIIAFQLLKNSVPLKEYLLFTDEYLNGHQNSDKIRMVPYIHNSEILGKIKTKFIDLKND